jgi:hypothetical protein
MSSITAKPLVSKLQLPQFLLPSNHLSNFHIVLSTYPLAILSTIRTKLKFGALLSYALICIVASCFDGGPGPSLIALPTR